MSHLPIIIDGGQLQQLPSGEALDVGGWTLPISGGTEDYVFVADASGDGVWTSDLVNLTSLNVDDITIDDAKITSGTGNLEIAANVGIGTSLTPEQKLDVWGDIVLGTGSGTPTLRFRGLGDEDTIYKYSTNMLATGGRFYVKQVGTQTNPAISYGTSTGTGFFMPVSGQMGLVTGGQERYRIDGNGHMHQKSQNDSKRIYFGVADDAYVTFSGSSMDLVANAVTATDTMTFAADTFQFLTGGVEVVNIDVSGTLTDGTASLTGGSLTAVKLGSLTTNGLVKTSGGDGTLSVDTTSLSVPSPTADNQLLVATGAGAASWADYLDELTIRNSGDDIAQLGSELVTNGDFASDLSDWTVGANWIWNAAGKAEHTSGSTAALSQDISVTNGVTYQVTYDWTDPVGGQLWLTFGSMIGNPGGYASLDGGLTTWSFKATSTGVQTLTFTPESATTCKLDNVSVKAIVTASDWTLLIEDSASASAMEVRADGTLENLYAGVDSGYSNIYGYNNTAWGFGTHKENVNGYSNTMFGHSAMTSSLNGYECDAFGEAALGSMVFGWMNGAWGFNALGNYIGGIGNTAIGANALDELTYGERNTAVGGGAGQSLTSDNETSSFSVYLGYYALASSDGGADYEVVLGAGARGKGTGTIVLGGLIHTDVYIPRDDAKLIFGEDDDFSMEWDETNAVFTIASGKFSFVGGNIETSSAIIGSNIPSPTVDDQVLISTASGIAAWSTAGNNQVLASDGSGEVAWIDKTSIAPGTADPTADDQVLISTAAGAASWSTAGNDQYLASNGTGDVAWTNIPAGFSAPTADNQLLASTGVGTSAWTDTIDILKVDNITIDGAVISSDTGAISFSDENLSTTGNMGLGATATSAKLYVYSGTADSLAVIKSSTDDARIHLDAPADEQAVIAFLSAGNSRTSLYKPADTDDLRIFDYGLGTDKLTFRYNTPDVGINTSYPDVNLEINDTTGGELRLTYNDASGGAANHADLKTNSDGGLDITTTDGDGAVGHITLVPDGNVLVGTVTSTGAKLEVNGGIAGESLDLSNASVGNHSYKSILHYDGPSGATVGTLKITLPTDWVGSYIRVRIKGYNYKGTTGVWGVDIGGNPAGGGFWAGYDARLYGPRLHFDSVRLGRDTAAGKVCILLGTTSTEWNYPQIEVDILAGGNNQTVFGGTWAAAIIASETGVTDIVTCDLSRDVECQTTDGLVLTSNADRTFSWETKPFGYDIPGPSNQYEMYQATGAGAASWTTDIAGLTSLGVDNITINGASITSDTGAISFGDENLSITGYASGLQSLTIGNTAQVSNNFLGFKVANTATCGIQFVDDDGEQWRWYKVGNADPNLILARYDNSVWQGSTIICRYTDGSVFFPDGDVAIGSTSASEKLDVTGNIVASGTVVGTNIPSPTVTDKVLTSTGADTATWQDPPSGGHADPTAAGQLYQGTGGTNAAWTLTPTGLTSINVGGITIASGTMTTAAFPIDLLTTSLTTLGTLTGAFGVFGQVSVGASMTIASGSITDTTGSISFGNEAVSTTGTMVGTNIPSPTAAGKVLLSTLVDTATWQDISWARLLTSGETIYVRTTGNDSNDGTSEVEALLTPGEAINRLYQRIANGYNIVVDLGEGEYTITSPLVPAYPYGEQVEWRGSSEDVSGCVISNIGSVTASGEDDLSYIDFDVTLTGKTATVGDFLLIKTATGGSNPHMTMGCHEITAWNGGTSKATVRCYRVTGPTEVPDTSVTVDVTWVKTVLTFTISGGLKLIGAFHSGYWGMTGYGMVFKGEDVVSNKFTNTAVWAVNGSSVILGPDTGTSGWDTNVYAQNGALVYADGSVHSRCSGWSAVCQNGAVLNLRDGSVISGVVKIGVWSYIGGSVAMQDGHIYACGAGSSRYAIYCAQGATVDFTNGTMKDGHDSAVGVRTDTGGSVDLTGYTNNYVIAEWLEQHEYATRLVTDSDYTLISYDSLVLFSTGTSDRAANLPTAVGLDGKRFTIKKIDSAANDVIIYGYSSETIDGNNTYGGVNDQYDSVTLTAHGGAWYVTGITP